MEIDVDKLLTKPLMRLLSFLIPSAFLIISINARAIENEAYYSQQFCDDLSGKSEYLLHDLSRVDCLTQTHAFEVDWADGSKVYEAIGQSLYYSSETGKLPGILLLIRKENSEKYIRKVKRVIEAFGLPIKLILLDVRS